MGTNGYQRVLSPDPFGPQLSSATRLAKWPIQGGTNKIKEILDLTTENEPDPVTPRLPSKKTKTPLAARFESLLAVSAVIGSHHDIEGLFSALATELLRVVDFDFIGICRYVEATNRI